MNIIYMSCLFFITVPSLIQGGKEFTQFDEFHQFHFLPALLPKRNDTCVAPISPEGEYNVDYCEVNTFNEVSQPLLDHITNVGQENLDVNLKVFVSWSEWSSCTQGLKTRYGKRTI